MVTSHPTGRDRLGHDRAESNFRETLKELARLLARQAAREEIAKLGSKSPAPSEQFEGTDDA